MGAFHPTGFTSADFPGVSPRTRFGSFRRQPSYTMPQPGFVRGLNFFRPLDAGFLRLPQLHVASPSRVFAGVNRNAGTPTIRRQRTGATYYRG